MLVQLVDNQAGVDITDMTSEETVNTLLVQLAKFFGNDPAALQAHLQASIKVCSEKVTT
jgi:hypothetical protein